MRKNQRHQVNIINVNKNLMGLFSDAEIAYKDGHNLLSEIQSMDAFQMKELLSAFRSLVTLRNTTKEEDYILSPVANAEGKFFRTNGDFVGAKPANADAVSAYCIALKGLQMLKEDIVFDEKSQTYKFNYPKQPNLHWLEWMQEKKYQE